MKYSANNVRKSTKNAVNVTEESKNGKMGTSKTSA